MAQQVVPEEAELRAIGGEAEAEEEDAEAEHHLAFGFAPLGATTLFLSLRTARHTAAATTRARGMP